LSVLKRTLSNTPNVGSSALCACVATALVAFSRNFAKVTPLATGKNLEMERGPVRRSRVAGKYY
jgi:hypothetical protein